MCIHLRFIANTTPITSAHALSTKVAYFTIVCTGSDFKTSCLCRFLFVSPLTVRVALLHCLSTYETQKRPGLTLIMLKESVRTARLTRRVGYKTCQRMVSVFVLRSVANTLSAVRCAGRT